MDNKLEKYYEILGVTRDASASIIEIARKRKLQLYSNYPIKQQEIEEAYSALLNKENTAEYQEESNKQKEVNVEKTAPTPSNHGVSKIEDPIIDEQQLRKEAKIKKENRKRILSNSLIMGGSLMLFGPIGGVVAAITLHKKGKFKLQKTSKPSVIKDVKTEESMIIKTYQKKLEESIEELLQQPHNNHELEIARLKYKNHVKLLQRRIEIKRNEISQLGGKTKNRLELLALELRLNASIKYIELQKLKAEKKVSMLSSYNVEDKETKLNEIYENIEEVQEELLQPAQTQRKKNLNNIKLRKLNEKKLNLINKMSLKKNSIARKQLLLAAVNSITNKFRGYDNSQEEVVQEENVRTRH